jgi:hypothetical protein
MLFVRKGSRGSRLDALTIVEEVGGQRSPTWSISTPSTYKVNTCLIVHFFQQLDTLGI